MTRLHRPRQRATVWLAVACITLAHVTPTYAHEKRVHQDMTDTAFKIMQRVHANPDEFTGNWQNSSVNFEEVRIHVFDSMVSDAGTPSFRFRPPPW